MKKADNFNPGKWLVENKITTQSRLNEAKDPDSVVSQEARDMFYNAVAKVMKDLYQADIMDNDIIDDYLGTEGGLLGDAIEAFLHPEDLDESKLDEGKVKNQYVVKDEEESDEYGDFYSIDKKKAFEYLKQFNSKEVSAKQFIKDDEGFEEFESNLDDVEQMTDKEIEKAMKEELSFYYFSKPDEI